MRMCGLFVSFGVTLTELQTVIWWFEFQNGICFARKKFPAGAFLFQKPQTHLFSPPAQPGTVASAGDAAAGGVCPAGDNAHPAHQTGGRQHPTAAGAGGARRRPPAVALPCGRPSPPAFRDAPTPFKVQQPSCRKAGFVRRSWVHPVGKSVQGTFPKSVVNHC